MSDKQKSKYEFQSIEFLNATIDEIYHRKKHYVKGIDLLNFKCALAPYFVRIERVFRYVYFSDISLDVGKLDKELFREQFPFIFNNFENNEYIMRESDGGEVKVDGITYFFWFLERFRNINLHSVISTPLSTTMKIDESFIDLFPKISEQVLYVKKGILTIAGMLIMMFSVIDEDNLEKLLEYFLTQWGKSIYGSSAYEAVKEKRKSFMTLFHDVFQTEYRVKIRKTGLTGDILKDLFGRLYADTEIENDTNGNTLRFKLDISERLKAPRFGVCGSLSATECGYCLTINKGSYFGKCFETDYKLTIIDEKLFCELCNVLPPFMLVAFCYHNAISEFNCLNKVLLEKIERLRYAKFYRDKDLTILCANDNYADLREINTRVAENTIRLFLDFEEKMVFSLDINIYGTYSKLSNVTQKLDVPDELSKRLSAVRNFCAHYGLLSSLHYSNRHETIFIDLKFIVGTIRDFIVFLRDNGYDKYAHYLTKDLHKYIFDNIIGVKYKRIFLNSAHLFNETDEDKLDQLLKGISTSLITAEKSIVSGEDEIMFTAFTDRDFSFNLSRDALLMQYGRYMFRELNLIVIQGEGIVLNGCTLKQTTCKFIETPLMDITAVTLLNPKQRLRLDRIEKVGILNKHYYTISEGKE